MPSASRHSRPGSYERSSTEGSTWNIAIRDAFLTRLEAIWQPAWPPLSEETRHRLALYYEWLRQWNRRLNLTRLTSPEDMATQHVADSAQGLPYLEGEQILDVGSGAGFPGLVLAILRPELHVTLLDARAKRVEFLAHVARMTGLTHVRAVHGVWPDAAVGMEIETLVSRATFSEIDSFGASGTMPAPPRRILLWRGDIEETTPGGRVLPYSLPGLVRPRHLLLLERGNSWGTSSP